MIGESYVSFDTAKLLKEAGFDVPCFNQYTERGTIWHCDCPENFNKSQCVTSCPEEKKIFIEVSMFWIGNWTYCIKNRNGVERKEIIYERRFRTYEKALEAGLREAIKLIKK